MFAAAALIIDTLRTFFLVVLSILGPIAFAFSVWDGFHSTLSAWFSRYIQIYLWLPVSDLFSTILAKIQILMLQQDIERMQTDPNFSLDASDGVYIVFLIIGIVGYFTIPTVAGWIISKPVAASAATTRTSEPPGLWAAAWQVQPQETWRGVPGETWRGVPGSSSRERLERCSRGNSRNGRNGTLGLPMCHSDLPEVPLRKKDTET